MKNLVKNYDIVVVEQIMRDVRLPLQVPVWD